MANVNTKAHVLVRDCFTCRYCGAPLYLSQAIKVLDWHVPGLDLWDLHGQKEPLRTLWATVDHITPEAEGGMDVLDNLVACCVRCNSSKGATRGNVPGKGGVAAKWNGLSGIFLGLAPRYEDRLSAEDLRWNKALEREGVHPNLADLEAQVEALIQMKAQAPTEPAG